MDITVAVDCMGGDHGPSVTIPAALAFLAEGGSRRVVLVGPEEALRRELAARGGFVYVAANGALRTRRARG